MCACGYCIFSYFLNWKIAPMSNHKREYSVSFTWLDLVSSTTVSLKHVVSSSYSAGLTCPVSQNALDQVVALCLQATERFCGPGKLLNVNYLVHVWFFFQLCCHMNSESSGPTQIECKRKGVDTFANQCSFETDTQTCSNHFTLAFIVFHFTRSDYLLQFISTWITLALMSYI